MYCFALNFFRFALHLDVKHTVVHVFVQVCLLPVDYCQMNEEFFTVFINKLNIYIIN